MSQIHQMHKAAALGDVAALQELLDLGMPIDCKDDDGATPLFAAALRGQLAAAEFLIRSGANVNSVNEVNYTPLMAAGREKHPEMVELLLNANADSEIEHESGQKAIFLALMDTIPNGTDSPYATESRLIEVLEVYRQHGIDVNIKGRIGDTLLMHAAWWGLVDTCEYLMKHGVSPQERDGRGQTAEDYAKKKLAKNLGDDLNESCCRIISLLGGKPPRKP